MLKDHLTASSVNFLKHADRRQNDDLDKIMNNMGSLRNDKYSQ
jgi:hypothetical protein